MSEPRCVMCGKPAEATGLETQLCADCRKEYREFQCERCGVCVTYSIEHATHYPELAASICSACHMRERAAVLPATDRDAIRAALKRGTFAAVVEAHERLDWSLRDVISLVHVLYEDD